MLESLLEERRDKMFRFKVEMFFIKSFKWLLMKTPESFRYKFAECLGLLAYEIIKKRREVTLDNIRKALPEKSEVEVIRIAKESYKVMVKTFMMSLWIPDTCGNDSKVKYHNYELFEQAKAQNKGVIVASLHMGCFEAMQKIALNNEAYDVVKKQKNPLLDKYMNDNRKRTGINIIYKGSSATKELVKALKTNKIICLFSDHYDDGAEVMFFGRKTKASTGVSTLALKYGSPVVLVHNILDENNVNTIYFDKIIELEKTGNVKKDVEINTQMMINEFEELIKKYPEQWMWFHRRWKN